MIITEAREGHVGSWENVKAQEAQAISTERLHKATTEDFLAVFEAYCDSSESYNWETQQTPDGLQRALLFWSDGLFTGEQLKKTFAIALKFGGDSWGYNEFGPDALDAIIEAFRVDEPIYQPAREYSCAVYVHTEKRKYSFKKLEKITKADEVSYQNGVYRFWWD